MSEETNQEPLVTTKSDNTEVRNGHNDAPVHTNHRPKRFFPSKPEDQATEQHLRRRNLVRAGAVFLVLLCLGLVAAVIVLAIEKKEANQLRSDVDKLISERDELQTSYSEATNLSHDLKQKTNLLKDENEFLENYNRNLTNEIDGLKTQMESTRCPSNWINFENSCYFISTTSKSWSDGRSMCQDHGADLVIISNIMEQKFISSLNLQVWIGLAVEKTENSLKWVNGEAATTTYWHEGEPNNLGLNENCVEMTSIVPINNWNDLACHYPLKFICEKVLP